MDRRTNTWVYVVIILLVIGLFARLSSNPLGIFLPLILFGIIFFLFKYPPRWLLRLAHQPPKRATYKQSTSRNRSDVSTIKNTKKKAAQRKRRKNVKLRVIDGKKKDLPPRRKTQ